MAILKIDPQVTLTGVETLTNKTLSSPALPGTTANLTTITGVALRFTNETTAYSGIQFVGVATSSMFFGRATGVDDLIISTAVQSAIEIIRFKQTGSIVLPSTITAPATTGNQTINKPTGRVNIAAAGTTETVTDSLVSANSIVLAVAATADATARVTNVVPGAGSFIINTVAVTAETAFNFLVLS